MIPIEELKKLIAEWENDAWISQCTYDCTEGHVLDLEGLIEKYAPAFVLEITEIAKS